MTKVTNFLPIKKMNVNDTLHYYVLYNQLRTQQCTFVSNCGNRTLGLLNPLPPDFFFRRFSGHSLR